MRILRLTLAAVAISVAFSGFGISQAGAFTSLPGRLFTLTDISGTNGDLFKTRPSNSWLRLTRGLSFPESVSAAPNGSFAVICAAAVPGGTYRIYRVPAAGGPLRNLIGNRSGCGQSVSPDNRKVAYIADTGTGGSSLNVVGSLGGRVRTLYRFASSGMYEPIWVGGRIFFERRVSRNPSSPIEVYSVRARDGRKLRRHTNHAGQTLGYGLTDVSPNGERLLIRINDPVASTDSLWVFSLRNRTRFNLATISTSPGASIGDASFSPSARSVAMIMKPDAASPDEIWTGSARAGSFFSLFPSPRVATNGPYSLDWVRR
jgi:Tol biopolymer transport system component